MQDDPKASAKRNSDHSSSETESEDPLEFVPLNPSEWDENHIRTWIVWVSKKFNIFPSLEPGRFPKAGSDLCKFTKADFWVCAGSKIGGDTLSKHFAYLGQTGTGLQDRSLENDSDPCE